MEIKKLEKLKELLIEWQSEYPFTHEHKETIVKIISWVENLIKGYHKRIRGEI